MGKQVIAAATAIVLGIIPTYGMAAGTDMHEMEDTAPSPAAAAVASEVLDPGQPFWEPEPTGTMSQVANVLWARGISER
jgi:hypothetical protein